MGPTCHRRWMRWMIALGTVSSMSACPAKPMAPPPSPPPPEMTPELARARMASDQPGWNDEAEVDPEPDPFAATAPSRPATDGAPGAVFIAAHNRVRAQHCAAPLTWSPELAKVAQAWADTLRDGGCGFEHSRTRYGENLAAGTSGALDAESATAMWYREVDGYDFKSGGFSMSTGHFTQVVWAQTARLGCGTSTCNGMDIIVCNYDPPGNVDGGYRHNVKPAGCKP